MSIEQIDVLVGAIPGVDPSVDVVQDVAVVRVRADGLEGFGETQSSPTLVRAVIEAPASRTLARSVTDVVLGARLEGPDDVDSLLAQLARATQIVGGSQNRRVTVQVAAGVCGCVGRVARSVC